MNEKEFNIMMAIGVIMIFIMIIAYFI